MDHSRIIRGAVGGGRYTVTAPITQWDYGYLFLPEIDDLPATYRLDFSNDEHHGTALSVYCGADGGEVPEELIDTGKDIFVWYFYIGDGYGKTEYKWRIPNKCKPKGDGETPEPSQQSSIDQLIYVANEAIDTAHESASQASASAQSASESAEQAQESARTAGLYSDTAQTYANSAEISANSASASATASAQSAEASARCSADAQDSAEDAQASASASAQSATASANSASQASASATSASQSATSAQGYASQAQTSAQTASAKAQEASTSASTASQKVTEASQSATNASQSAQTAEQAKTASQTAQGLAESARDSAIDAKTDAETARDEAQNLVDGISGKVEQIDSNTERIESLEDDRYKPYATDSASGSIASFVDGADDIPLKSLTVNIDPVQDTSSGDPSPENICPISGWTGITVNATGKNLFDKDACQVVNNYYIDASGNFVSHANYTYTETYQPVESNTQYVLSGTIVNAGTYNAVAFYDKGKRFISRFRPATSGVNAVFTTPSDCAFIRWNMRKEIYDLSTIQLEKGGTATAYEPFGRSIPISWQTEAGTVYGGKLDVLSGVLTVDRAMATLDGSSDEQWVLQSINSYGIANFNTPIPHYPEKNYKSVCNMLAPQVSLIANESTEGYFIHQNGVTVYFRISVDRASTVDEWRAWLAQNNIQLVYSLAEPIEIQLTPTEVRSLLGQNNIFADTGDTACEYRADTTLYISRLTEPDTDMIADSNIVSGQYFMVGNSLFKATANIASGASVIVGTNAIRKSLSEALNEINA